MPNNSYLRSRKKEQELVKELRALGYMACRSAGSKSEYDVWAVRPSDGSVMLVQIKTKIGCSVPTRSIIKSYPGQVIEWWFNYDQKKRRAKECKS